MSSTTTTSKSCPVDTNYSDNYNQRIEGTGTWTTDEHDRFLTGIAMYPKGPWKKVAVIVKTRSVRQLRTHAQKFREKMARRERRVECSVSSASSTTSSEDREANVDWENCGVTHKYDGEVNTWVGDPISFARTGVQYDECALFLLEAFGEWGCAL
ncbi:hypothetical protein DYB28_005116 [Aphanomyces astaci]|uniref:HTH myb-type domain-containing protein n=1 Tax=Aphanomyces astaci TaxID=112090 RepID=A0A397G1Z5_APHAT|nr:hypothetical protein DYB34_008271 [Aphanomyces astaci]RHY56800.1 hypothetical protein DYB38_014324 [Aphanomyces astaci]RHZ28085.1 hypothetical protein DYB26_014621 [Aphanomyces astaci]RHZ41673.1 hypothetical protein DYB31_011107 [Aphanomyces astaci]RLO06874.1 hypothetical protein DYB28_005116 [Aphanomyces astaci]